MHDIGFLLISHNFQLILADGWLYIFFSHWNLKNFQFLLL